MVVVNRAERRRQKRQHVVVNESPWWYADVAGRFDESVAAFIDCMTSMWQWTEFGVCASCNHRVSVVKIDVEEPGLAVDEFETSLTLTVHYDCGHSVPVGGAATFGFLPGTVELFAACAAALEV